MRQVGPIGGIVPPSTTTLAVGEGGQPAGEVGLIAVMAEVPPSTPSSILAKRNEMKVLGRLAVKSQRPL